MDSYAVLRGVSGFSDYLSKDRYYLDKMIKRSDDYGAGYQATIESRIAHHNQLVTVLNGLFGMIGQELGEFAPEQALFPVYVDPRSAADALVVTPKAPLVSPEPVVPVDIVESAPVVATPVEEDSVDVPSTDVTSPDVYVPEAPEPEREDETVQETSLEADVEVDTPEPEPQPEPEQAVAPKEPVTAREHVEAALSQHEAATGTELGLDEELDEPTAVSVLPSDTDSDEPGEPGITLAIPGFASPSDYQSVIHDDIARINGDAYGRPSVSHEADVPDDAPEPDSWDANEPTDHADDSSFDGFDESGDTEDDANGYPEDASDDYPDDAFGGPPEVDYPDEDPFNERP